MAFDPQTKLIPALRLRPRTQDMVHALVHGVQQALAPGCVPVCTSDGLQLYFYALTAHFGQWLTAAATGKSKKWQVAFTLSLESLRAIGSWAADCAERALAVYEMHADSDTRPRAAIEGIRVFAGGGKRTARLRTLALAALAAAREVGDPAVAAAARAACLAASSAYTHPLADVHQTKHIVGPAAQAVLADGMSRVV